MFILNSYIMEKHCNESFGAALVYVRKPFKIVHTSYSMLSLTLLLSVCGLSNNLNIALSGAPTEYYCYYNSGFNQDHVCRNNCSTSSVRACTNRKGDHF